MACAGDGMGRTDRLGDAGRGSSRYEGHDIEMGMKGHMPSRQLGTLESNFMGGRDRLWTTASAGQSQRGVKFTSTHLEALRASCFPRRGWQAQAHTCTEHTNSASRERDAQGSGGAWAGQMTYRARRLVLRPFGGCRGEPPRDGHSSIPGQAAHEKLLLNCPVFCFDR